MAQASLSTGSLISSHPMHNQGAFVIIGALLLCVSINRDFSCSSHGVLNAYPWCNMRAKSS
jgi:hypothetical protein